MLTALQVAEVHVWPLRPHPLLSLLLVARWSHCWKLSLTQQVHLER